MVGAVLLSSSVASADEPPKNTKPLPVDGSASPEAAPAPDAAAQDAGTEVVVTGTRTSESAAKAPVRVRVVTKAEAQRRGATNVAEALAGETGVQVNPSSYGSIGNPSAIQMQGFDLGRVLILEDGERVVGDTGGAIDLAAIPIDDIERIELVEGPTSSLYGTSAIGGVVNVISAGPELEGPSGRARVEARSRRGALFAGGAAYRKEDNWIGTDLSYQRSDGVKLRSDLPDLTIPDTERSLVGLRGGFRISDRVDVRARVRWLRTATSGVLSEEVPGAGRFISDLPDRNDRIAAHISETLMVGKDHRFELGAGQQWFIGESKKDRRNSPADEDRKRALQMHSLDATFFGWPSAVVSPTFGFHVEAESFHQDLEKTTVLPSGTTTTPLVEVEPTALATAATFAELRFRLGSHVTIVGGTRVEGSARYGGVVAPRLAIAISPRDWITFRLAGGRGYRAPSAKEIGFVFDHSAFGYRVLGNPDLKPESSWGGNGDVSIEPVKKLELRAGAFVNHISDLIDFQLAGSSGTGVDDYKYVNVGSAITFGVDAGARYRITDRLRAEVSYAYLWTRDVTNERPLPGRPPHTFTTGFTVIAPAEVEITARWRFVTSTFVDDDIRSPGFSTLDVRIAHEVWPRSKIYFGAQNLLGAQKDPNRLGDQRPIEGRTLYLGLSADFPWES